MGGSGSALVRTEDLEVVIQKYDYANPVMYGYLLQDLDNSVQKFAPQMNYDKMKTTIDVFISKVCVRPFPYSIHSDTYTMCSCTIAAIVQVMEACFQRGTIHQIHCQDLLFELVVALVGKGNTLLHYTLASYILEGLDMKRYLKSLTYQDVGVEKIKILFEALKQPQPPNDKRDMEFYFDEYINCSDKILCSLALDPAREKHMLPGLQEAFLDMYIFYMVEITRLPEYLNEDMNRKCRETIKQQFGDNGPYMGCKNIDLYKQHILTTKQLVLNPSYPRRDVQKDLKVVSNTLSVMFKELKKDNSMLKELAPSIKDLSSSMQQSKNSKVLVGLISEVEEFISHMPKGAMEENADPFVEWATRLIDMLKNANKDFLDRSVTGQINDWMKKIEPKKGYEKHWIGILTGLLRDPTTNMGYKAEEILKNDTLKRIWNWKNNIEGAKQIIVAVAESADIPIQKGIDSGDKNLKSNFVNYGRVIDELFDQLGFLKVSDGLIPDLANLIILSLEKRYVPVSSIGRGCVGKLNFKEMYLLRPLVAVKLDSLACHKARFNQTAGSILFSAHPKLGQYTIDGIYAFKNLDLIPEFLERVAVFYYDTDFVMAHANNKTIIFHSLLAANTAYTEGKTFQKKVDKVMVGICKFAMEEDTERHDLAARNYSVYGQVVYYVMPPFVRMHCTGPTPEVIKPLLPGIQRMMEEEDGDNLAVFAKGSFGEISANCPQIIGGDKTGSESEYDKLIDSYIKNMDHLVLQSLLNLADQNKTTVSKRFQDLFKTLPHQGGNLAPFLSFVMHVSDAQPEVITKENISALCKYIGNKTVGFHVLYILEKVAKYNPDMMLDVFTNVFINQEAFPPNGNEIVFYVNIMEFVAMKHRKYLEPVLKRFIKWTEYNDDLKVGTVIAGMSKLAHQYGAKPFAPYRKYLEKLKNRSTDMKIATQSLFDVLEGRSLAKVSDDVQQVKEDVEVLDERVTGTEIVVGGVVKQVERHEGEIKDVKVGVAKVNKRVDVVEEDLGEVKEKVEEIDMKTMSSAPTWSRDVTKLLNPKSDHDWRLLASRLGYTNDDIRAWATQSDPCMALLSEWYATHRTREATNGVLNILQEMNRLDAAIIVENAMKTVEGVVEDEDFEYPSPPPVFLSYQWGHQNEVKLLKQHLEMAGYLCWMDVGQMGGGDKLFEKIDAGIRGAKVVVCCVSEKYAKSPNCNREVNLSVNLRKPIIPLQMEKIQWPPAGAMGPIFSEYLYIRFYTGGNKGSKKYWANEKFQEILMQLQQYGLIPDEKLITKEYKNWWIPVAEEIVIPQKKNTGKSTNDSKSTSKEDKEKSPDVFISYQWDKQKQIQALYKRLTGLGFSCWMDIHQMGGGDSLYDKIDRGVRGCKVVLSSVTQKYALSANCRREVSLADALKKPVIPLLLEELAWPPTGPMSMVFTQLLYISFCKNPDIQLTWKGKEFEELLSKLYVHIPDLSGSINDHNKENTKVNPSEKSETNKGAKPASQTHAATKRHSLIHGDVNNQTGSKSTTTSSPSRTRATNSNNQTTTQSKQNTSSNVKPQTQINPPPPESSACIIL